MPHRRVRHLSPVSLGNCAMCLRANRETAYSDGGTVQTPTDIGAAGASFTQTVALTRPTWKTAIQGGQAVYRFSGTTWWVSISYAHFPSKRGAVLAVYNQSGGSTNAEILTTYPTGSPAFIFYSTNASTIYKWYDGSGYNFGSVLDSSTFSIQGVSRTGDTGMSYFRNSAAAATWTVANNQQSTTATSIGAALNTSEALTGDIAWIAEFSAALSIPVMRRMIQALAYLYRLPG